jgi:hypothetical protein
MDAKTLAESVEYERLTQAVYQAILRKEGDDCIEVKHNTDIKGRSGVAHQVDVSWRFRKAGVEHHVLIECKNYASDISLEKVRNLFAVQHDIGNCQGMMVTKTGYQSGVVDFAKYYGIGLKLLGKAKDEDWKDRIKDIEVEIHLVGVAQSPGKLPKVGISFDDEVKAAIASGDLRESRGLVFLNAEGVPVPYELSTWLSRKIGEDKPAIGGPYTKKIPLEDHYVELTDKIGTARRVKISGLEIEYHWEVLGTREMIVAGEEIVEAVLKDFSTGEVEHFHLKEKK